MEEKDELNQPSFPPDIQTEYANNTLFEATIWDLKILFGEFFARDGKVDWHTSMTIPWAQAKLMAYFLQVNVAIYEGSHGRIEIPAQMTPDEFKPPADGEAKSQELFARLSAMRRTFIDEMRTLAG